MGAPRVLSAIKVQSSSRNQPNKEMIMSKRSKEFREDRSDYKVREQMSGSKGFSG